MKLIFKHIVHNDSVSYECSTSDLNVAVLRRFTENAMRTIARQTNIQVSPLNVSVTIVDDSDKMKRAIKEMEGD